MREQEDGMTTKHEAALRAQAAEYAERMMRREWRVVPQAGIEPGDGRGNWYIEAIDTRFGMHSLVMWAYQSKSAYDRAFLERVCDEHNATIRDALTAQGERVAVGCDCAFGDTCSCAYDCRCRAEFKHLREEGGELINTGLRLVALEAPAPSAPPAECPNCGEPGDERYWKGHFYEGEWLCPRTPAHSADTEVR